MKQNKLKIKNNSNITISIMSNTCDVTEGVGGGDYGGFKIGFHMVGS